MNKVFIDRKALISRHNPVYSGPEINAPLSLGNGGFCYTADFTGLQTFPSRYSLFPLCVMADWGWHCYPDGNRNRAELRLTPFDTYGREVGYAVDSSGQEELFNSLRQNPHRFNLGCLGLDLPPGAMEECASVRQTLNMWEGCLDSSFTLWGETVTAKTLVCPDEDTVCVRLSSALFRAGKLRLRLAFPYGSHTKSGGDFSLPRRHKTSPQKASPCLLNIGRRLDGTVYTVKAVMDDDTRFSFDGEHCLFFETSGASLTLAFRFVPGGVPLPFPLDNDAPPIAPLPAGNAGGRFFDEAARGTSAFWESYWAGGGALDLGDSAAPGARELERRIILSQYLTAIQSRGRLPPSETGLTCNSWYGKFHLEMHYWHSAHFPLWGRAGELEKSLSWYGKIIGEAKRLAASQGYRGARWPKMCGPDGDNSPSSIAVLLAWQQPHPILMAELCYRRNKSRAFLEEYRGIVIESAEFMLSFVHWDGRRYVLGPPLIPAQERFDPRAVLNPGYEVEYFRWGLRQANVWLGRLGEKARPDFGEAADKLASPAVAGGVFPAHENCPATFTEAPFNTDHPSMLGMMGLLPGEGVDRAVMNATLDRMLKDWDLPSCWGWDFPMMAMTAARLGRRKDAVRLLLLDSPKNRYLPNGHNPQADREDLPLYLPANGGLLLAAACMAAGWDGDGGSPAPGFPDDGSFRVKTENISKYI
jgi:hypothetical protein